MTQVVGFTPEDWPIARDAINAVRRGGLEHPFHRRQSPVSSGDELILIKYTDTAAALGPRNSGGIQFEGDCEIYDHLVTGAATPSPIPTGTANGTYSVGVTLPGQFAWARFSDGKYFVQGGSHYLEGVLQDDIPANSSGGMLCSEDGIDDVEITVNARCDQTYVSGTRVGAGVRPFIGGSPNQCQITILWACCPDIDGD